MSGPAATGILFDARVIRPGMTGIGNYARSLLRALPASRTRIGILLPEGSPYTHDFPGCAIHFTRVALTAHPRTEWYEQFEIPRFCRRHGYGTFVSFEGRVPLFGRGLRTFAFVYDLAYRTVPGTHGLKYSLLLRVSQWIARARGTGVLTISEAVKDQITRYLGIPRAQTHVIYPSDSDLARFAPEVISDARAPYLLATSMTNPRKNLENLLRAFELLRVRHPELSLVITGHPAWIDRVISGTGVSPQGIVNAGFVTEGQLRALYQGAAAYVYPSFDEGFGIPLLDAARAGAPVACSDIPVFHEVLADTAAYFDPVDPEAIANAVERALTPRASDHTDRSADTGADTGVERARPGARFSWERSAERLLEILAARA